MGKEFWLEQAAERNRIGLPKVVRGGLPEEKWCLTGVGWGLKEEWSSEEEEQEGAGEDEVMGGMEVNEEKEGEGEEGGEEMVE